MKRCHQMKLSKKGCNGQGSELTTQENLSCTRNGVIMMTIYLPTRGTSTVTTRMHFKSFRPSCAKQKLSLLFDWCIWVFSADPTFFHHCPEYSDDMVEWPTRPEDEPTSEDPKQVKRRRLVPMSTHEDEDEDLLLNSEEEEEQELQL